MTNTNANTSKVFVIGMAEFFKIPGNPIAYWIKNVSVFSFPRLGIGYESGGRTKTHNNEKYVRNWWEISNNDKWCSYANGGDFRKWYGNDYDVVNWSIEARNEYASHGGLYNEKYWGKKGVCWNLITSYKNSFRLKRTDQHFSSGSPTIISGNETKDEVRLAFLNTDVAAYLLKMINPTLNTTVTDVLNLPFSVGENESTIRAITKDSISLSHKDWDMFEDSKDFKKHPLI